MTQKELFNYLIKNSPVPVIVADPSYIIKKNIKCFNDQEEMLEFINQFGENIPAMFLNLRREEVKKSKLPKKFILVRKKGLIHERIIQLLHEIGHSVCFKNKCKCFKPKEAALCECHADKYCLSKLLEYKLTRALNTFEMDIRCRWIWDGIYKQAAQKLMRTKIWKDHF